MKGSEKKKKAGNQAINGEKNIDTFSVMLWCKSATGVERTKRFC